MSITTVTHTAIDDRPVVDIVRNEPGPNIGKPFAYSFDDNGHRWKSSVEHYGLTQKEFPLHRVIKDYFLYYGVEEATRILIGKGIITSTPRAILWIPD